MDKANKKPKNKVLNSTPLNAKVEIWLYRRLHRYFVFCL